MIVASWRAAWPDDLEHGIHVPRQELIDAVGARDRIIGEMD